MMKQTGKRILAVLTALTVAVCSVVSAAAEHTHTYQVEAMVDSGYVNGGYVVYRCACGESYTEPISPRTQPYCVMTGGRVAPGESITIEATLQCCSGLADLTLDLAYDAQYLQLTDAACAQYGVPTRITDKALRFDSINPAAEEAVLYLTFTADADAPTGIQTVSLSGCGVSACTVDGGEEIIMTAQRTSVQVYRPPQMNVTAPAEPVFAGETVQMTIDFVNNPGVAGMALELHYDTQALTLTGVQEEGIFTEGNVMMSGTMSMMPFRVLWDDASAAQNHTEDGTILTLTFKVKDTAPAGTANVWVTFDPDDVLDVQLQPVELFAYDAQLTILRRVPGDADGDGEVDAADIVCMTRYIAGGWNVVIDERNSDVNADKVIDLKDVVLIRRYLTGGWNVVLL